MNNGRLVFGLGILMSFVLNVGATAATLDEKIGVVAASLFSGTVTNVGGASVAAAVASDWDEEFIAESSCPSNEVIPTFRSKMDASYDVVRRAFILDGKEIETRQTISVWTLTLHNQPTAAKSDYELAALVTAAATNSLNGFTERRFLFDEACGSVKVFRLAIAEGRESGDWRDDVWAIVDGAKIGFSTIKKETTLSAYPHSSSPEMNREWFGIAEQRGKASK